MQNTLETLFDEVRTCTLCAEHLPHVPRPVVRGSTKSRLLIVGQAPGSKVHATGIPFNDPSGDRLRDWLGIDRQTFYDEQQIALLPMGFCYPGTGKSGDLPPRPECAKAWREPLLAALTDIQLTLVIGQYAQAYHLYPTQKRAPSVTDTVANWQSYWPEIIPLPHPSPRNSLWLRRNPWFEKELLPQLKQQVNKVIRIGRP